MRGEHQSKWQVNVMDYQPIENYSVIGNMRSLALVSVTGSIDFFCFPKFDSPTVFAALLDPDKGGFFCIQPNLENSRTKQLYLPDTNILITRFLSENGIAEMTDFMPVVGKDYRSHVVRRMTVIQGDVEFTLQCHPRFDYARASHRIERDDNAVIFLPECDQPPLVLNGSLSMAVEGDGVVQSFRLKAGEAAVFAFGEDSPEARRAIDDEMIERKFHDTAQYWRTWIAQSNYTGRWREMVSRSALLLKLLSNQEHGSLIAAPTFGLPEQIGGTRNWDYRYTWLRDASFSLYAMMRLGFVEEAAAFQLWLNNRLRFDAEEGPLQVLYRTDGSTDTPEVELNHLRGYMDSRPVRIGNAAWNQLQLDIYGELIDAIYLSSKYGDGLSIDEWNGTKRVLRWLSEHWQKEDDGIWEVRGGRKHFLHSRLMCWVAFDRAIRLGAKRSLAGPFDWMEKTRDEITEDIHTNFWNPSLQSFVQYKGSSSVDAAVLLMPLVRFISPTDPRWLSTLAAIERDLTVDTLVFRYRNVGGLDGIGGTEGSFTACSFWFIEALARSNQIEKARILFEKMLGYANHVGLYAEQLGASGEHLGNFPQALTHLALISAATYLDRELSGRKQEPWR
jgi:GH15 family glucan-1,4-alpha-glucosidase